jgi:TonB family protein
MSERKIVPCLIGSLFLHIFGVGMVYQRPALCEAPAPMWAKGNCMLDVHMVAAGVPGGAKGGPVIEEIPDVKVAAAEPQKETETAPAITAPDPEEKIALAKSEAVAVPGETAEKDRKKKSRVILLRRKAHFKKALAAAAEDARRALSEKRGAAQGSGAAGMISRNGSGLSNVPGGNGGTDVMNVQAGIRNGAITSFIAPMYPVYSRRKGHEGDVLVEGVIIENGSVGDCRLIQSSGHEELDRAALRAMLRARFNPARIAGFAVKKTVRLPFSFRLDAGRTTALAASRAGYPE